MLDRICMIYEQGSQTRNPRTTCGPTDVCVDHAHLKDDLNMMFKLIFGYYDLLKP